MNWGPKKIKRDIYVDDPSGRINMQVFESKVALFEDGKCYKITHATLNKFLGGLHVSLNADTRVTEIPEIKGLKPIVSATKSLRIDMFSAVRNIHITYTCRGCKKNIDLEDDSSVERIRCTNPDCGASSPSSKLKAKVSCQVNIDVDDDQDIWVTLFDDVIKKLIPHKVKNSAEVEKVLNGLTDFTVVYDEERFTVKDIIIPPVPTVPGKSSAAKAGTSG